MSDKVIDQILKVQNTGLSNMFDLNAVKKVAFALGFDEMVVFIEEHKKEYAHFILTGER